jgi:GR25 family glycosyltransferase involved in LPS biosynthesis
MLPLSFEQILHGPCTILNMDKCQDERWDIVEKRVKDAGFVNVIRESAIDGMNCDLPLMWKNLGVNSNVEYAFKTQGQSGCTLSHIHLWQKIINNNISFMTVFEDDVMFHKHWHNLAENIFWYLTDKTCDLVYMGSHGGFTPHMPLVLQHPVYCTHAYIITLEGARKLVDLFLTSKKLEVIDNVIHMLMSNNDSFLRWQCWNATSFDDNARNTAYKHRNDGLVYQDASFQSNVIPYYNNVPKWKAHISRFIRKL